MSKEESSEETEQKALTKVERKLQRREEKAKARQKEMRQRKTKKGVKWALVFVGLLLIVGFLTSQSSNKGSEESTSVDLEITDSDWVKGNRGALVTLVEYADFQCPACANYSPIIKRLSEEYGDRIAFVYRHFPLKQIHKNAESAAIAAEAAGQQGKFWEMHDLLFDRQDDWSDSKDINSVFKDYSQGLDLDVDKFMQDLDSDTIAEKVDSHYNGAIRLGINSTPTFFLNDQELDSVRSYDQFKEVIEKAISSGS